MKRTAAIVPLNLYNFEVEGKAPKMLQYSFQTLAKVTFAPKNCFSRDTNEQFWGGEKENEKKIITYSSPNSPPSRSNASTRLLAPSPTRPLSCPAPGHVLFFIGISPQSAVLIVHLCRSEGRHAQYGASNYLCPSWRSRATERLTDRGRGGGGGLGRHHGYLLRKRRRGPNDRTLLPTAAAVDEEKSITNIYSHADPPNTSPSKMVLFIKHVPPLYQFNLVSLPPTPIDPLKLFFLSWPSHCTVGVMMMTKELKCCLFAFQDLRRNLGSFAFDAHHGRSPLKCI